MSNTHYIVHRGVEIPIKAGMFGNWYVWEGRRYAILLPIQEAIDAQLNEQRQQRTETPLIAAQRD